MPLKTLKDLRKELKKLNNPDEEYLLGIRDFERWTKAEAIKWVKEFRKHPTNSIGEIEFMNFSNITEEDLK